MSEPRRANRATREKPVSTRRNSSSGQRPSEPQSATATTTSRTDNPAFIRDSGKAGRDCPLCPRLVEFRMRWREEEPGWFNAPVASFGLKHARLLIVGLAPGLQGANRTGRPFTGDYAGDLLYQTLVDFGFARGRFEARVDDSLELIDVRITNAVRCVPPENKPTPLEMTTCRSFLDATIREMENLKAIVALGRIGHDAVVTALGARKSAVKFGHGAQNNIGSITLFDSYHCSRYNTNTGVLTPEMFRAVFESIRAFLNEDQRRSA